jgi:hypothetical protein
MATLCCGDRVRAATILDLSVPGCHLATSLPLKKGQCVRMEVYLINQPPMRIELGVVRWAAQGEAGIEFIRMSEEDASGLRVYAQDGVRNETVSHAEPEARKDLGVVGP